jgi:hypothetical protein
MAPRKLAPSAPPALRPPVVFYLDNARNESGVLYAE